MTPKSSHEINADGKFAGILLLYPALVAGPASATPRVLPSQAGCGSADMRKKIAPENALAEAAPSIRHKRKNPGAGPGF